MCAQFHANLTLCSCTSTENYEYEGGMKSPCKNNENMIFWGKFHFIFQCPLLAQYTYPNDILVFYAF